MTQQNEESNEQNEPNPNEPQWSQFPDTEWTIDWHINGDRQPMELVVGSEYITDKDKQQIQVDLRNIREIALWNGDEGFQDAESPNNVCLSILQYNGTELETFHLEMRSTEDRAGIWNDIIRKMEIVHVFLSAESELPEDIVLKDAEETLQIKFQYYPGRDTVFSMTAMMKSQDQHSCKQCEGKDEHIRLLEEQMKEAKRMSIGLRNKEEGLKEKKKGFGPNNNRDIDPMTQQNEESNDRNEPNSNEPQWSQFPDTEWTIDWHINGDRQPMELVVGSEYITDKDRKQIQVDLRNIREITVWNGGEGFQDAESPNNVCLSILQYNGTEWATFDLEMRSMEDRAGIWNDIIRKMEIVRVFLAAESGLAKDIVLENAEETLQIKFQYYPIEVAMTATMESQDQYSCKQCEGKDEHIRLLEEQMKEAKRMIIGLRNKEEGFHKTLVYMKTLRQREEDYLQEIANQEKAINAFAAAFIHTKMQRQHWNALKSALQAIEDHETHLGVNTVIEIAESNIVDNEWRPKEKEQNMELQRVLEENRNVRSELDAINSRIERVWKHIPPSQHGDESNESKQILSPNQSKQINIEKVLMESRHSLHYLEHRISQREVQIESSNNENRDEQRASTVSERELTEAIKSQIEMVQNEMEIIIKEQNDETLLLKKNVQDLQQKLSHKDQEMEKLQEMIKEKEHVTKEAEEERDLLFGEIRNRDAKILKLQSMLKKNGGQSTVKPKPKVERKREGCLKEMAKTKWQLTPQTGDGVDENHSASESVLQRDKEHLKAIANQEKTINALKTALKANRNRETTEMEVKMNENLGSVEVVSLQYEAPQQLLVEEENKGDNTTSDLVDLKIEEELDIEGNEEWDIAASRKSIRTDHRRSTEIGTWKLNRKESAGPLPVAIEMNVNLTDDIRLHREREREMEYQNAVKAVHRLSSGIVSMGQEMERMERQWSMQSDHRRSKFPEPMDTANKLNGNIEVICKETENDLDTMESLREEIAGKKLVVTRGVNKEALEEDKSVPPAHERRLSSRKETVELQSARNEIIAQRAELEKVKVALNQREEESQALQLRTDDAERSITDLRRLITAKDVDIEVATNRNENHRAIIRKVRSEMVVLRETLIAAKRESMAEIKKKSKAKMARLIAERNVLRRKSRKSEHAEKEIVRLKEDLKNHDAVVEKQRSEIKKLKAKKKGERGALTNGIKKRNSEISNLRNELDTKNEMLHALQVQMAESNTESDTLEKEMGRFHEVNQKKATKLEMDQSNTRSKSKDVSNSGMHSDINQGKEDEYRKQIVELQQQIENQQKAINAMSKALENRQMESHLVAAQQDVDGVNVVENPPTEDSLHINDGLLRRGVKGHDSKSAKNQLKTSLEENRRETLDLRAMLREKDRVIEGKDIDIESAAKRVENQRAFIRKIHSEMYVLKKTLIAAKREQMATKSEAENKEEMKKVSRAKIAKLVAQRNVLRRRLKENEDAMKEIVELKEVLKHQNAVLEKQESEIKQLKVTKKGERRSLEKGIKKRDSEISKLHNELDTKNEINRVLQDQMVEANTEIDGLRKEMDRLHEALNQEKANKLEAEHLISFQDEYKEQIAGLKQQIENQSKTMSAMEQEILTKAMDSFSNEMKEIIEDMNSMIDNKINSSLVGQQIITGQHRKLGFLLMLCTVGVLLFVATQHHFEYLKERTFGPLVLIGQEQIDSSWTFVSGVIGFGMMSSFLCSAALSYL